MAKKTKTVEPEKIAIPAPDIRTIKIKVIGTSPLMMNKWSEKARTQIEEKQAKKAQRVRPIRNPKREFEEAQYKIGPRKWGIPARMFKAAMVRACMDLTGISMMQARGLFFVRGDLIPIVGPAPVMDTRFVRLKGRGRPADLRYRPRWDKWECTLLIDYDAESMSASQIINLLNRAGIFVGLGELRPRGEESTGNFGQFKAEQAA